MPGSVLVPPEPLAGILLVFLRVSSWLAFVPLPGLARAPARLRALLAVSLTVALLPAAPAPDRIRAGEFVAAAARELSWGLGLGVATALLFEGLQVGAQLAGLQAGYSFASTVDPASEADSGVLNVWMLLFGAAAAGALGLDRALLRLAAEGPPAELRGGAALAALGARMWTTALAVALPLVAALLTVDLLLSLVSRSQPSLPLLSLAFPAKMLASLWLLGMLSPQLLRVFRAAAAAMLAAFGARAQP
jgi:flagellar biosynthetic protein FliR